MKIKQNKKTGMTEITTEVYQTCYGRICMNWGNTIIRLDKDDASIVAYDIKDFDVELYNKFYK